jgi:hypothetical protein
MCLTKVNLTVSEQEKHQLKLRKPLSEVVDFEIADWMFSCEFPPTFVSLLDSLHQPATVRLADTLQPVVIHASKLSV